MWPENVCLARKIVFLGVSYSGILSECWLRFRHQERPPTYGRFDLSVVGSYLSGCFVFLDGIMLHMDESGHHGIY